MSLDEGKDHRDENKFFEALGSRGDIKDASEGGDDVAFEKHNQTSVTLYRYVLPWKRLPPTVRSEVFVKSAKDVSTLPVHLVLLKRC